MHDTRQGPKAVVNPVLCKGDGLCNAKCPTGAISLKHFTDQEIECQIDMMADDEDMGQEVDMAVGQ
jgi:heterodisulfide reductase subunit A